MLHQVFMLSVLLAFIVVADGDSNTLQRTLLAANGAPAGPGAGRVANPGDGYQQDFGGQLAALDTKQTRLFRAGFIGRNQPHPPHTLEANLQQVAIMFLEARNSYRYSWTSFGGNARKIAERLSWIFLGQQQGVDFNNAGDVTRFVASVTSTVRRANIATLQRQGNCASCTYLFPASRFPNLYDRIQMITNPAIQRLLDAIRQDTNPIVHDNFGAARSDMDNNAQHRVAVALNDLILNYV